MAEQYYMTLNVDFQDLEGFIYFNFICNLFFLILINLNFNFFSIKAWVICEL